MSGSICGEGYETGDVSGQDSSSECWHFITRRLLLSWFIDVQFREIVDETEIKSRQRIRNRRDLPNCSLQIHGNLII